MTIGEYMKRFIELLAPLKGILELVTQPSSLTR